MVCQGLEALHGVRRAELHPPSWLVEEAVHIGAEAEESTLPTIHLDGSIKTGARLHRHISITEKNEVPHEAASTKLGGHGLLGNELGVVGLAIMLQVVWMEVMEGFTRPARLVDLPLPALQNIVELETDVIDLRIPLGRHHFRESPGIAPGLCEIENHVLDERAPENVVVLERWPLVQQLVVLARRSTAIERFPSLLEVSLRLGIVVLALGIFDGT
mmetsp:Transcript_89705/g.124627  ORF Transcript_89705/g.124627 Transcript_89705/m.124627 type:complete len:216 (+) Transcript_89705:699-1346(+)